MSVFGLLLGISTEKCPIFTSLHKSSLREDILMDYPYNHTQKLVNYTTCFLLKPAIYP